MASLGRYEGKDVSRGWLITAIADVWRTELGPVILGTLIFDVLISPNCEEFKFVILKLCVAWT